MLIVRENRYFGTLPGFVKEAHSLILALNGIHKPAEEMSVKKLNWMQLIYAMPEGTRVPIDEDDGVTAGKGFTVVSIVNHIPHEISTEANISLPVA